jgi:hypothetical protein
VTEVVRQKLRSDAAHVGPNEVLRFFLEIGALFAMAFWAWAMFDGLLQVVVAIGLPAVAAIAWAIFRVPNDPGPAPVVVPGIVRLALEAVFFGSAVVLLYLAGEQLAAIIFGAVVVLHYVVGRRRVFRLLRGEPPR